MILCLANVHASIFKTNHQAFFLLLNARRFVSVCVIRKSLPANIFGNFLFDSLSFINANLNVRNNGFKQWQYTCKLNINKK